MKSIIMIIKLNHNDKYTMYIATHYHFASSSIYLGGSWLLDAED